MEGRGGKEVMGCRWRTEVGHTASE
jgi:hypothetical protein